MGKAPILASPSPEAELLAWAVFAVKALGWTAAFAIIALLGWAVSSLHVLAGWSGGLAARLEIVKGILASLAGGGIVGMLGIYTETPVMLTLIGVFAGGFSGERYLRPLVEEFLQRVFGRIPGAK